MGQRTVSCFVCWGVGTESRVPAHTRASWHSHPDSDTTSRTTTSRSCAAALVCTEPLKSREKPILASGNRSYLPSMHPNTGTPQKRKVSAPWISPDKGKPWQGSPTEGSQCPPPRDSCAVARDWLLITRSMFPAVTGASPVRSLPDGDFSTFVALLSHLHLSPLLRPRAALTADAQPLDTEELRDTLRVPGHPRPCPACPWPWSLPGG